MDILVTANVGPNPYECWQFQNGMFVRCSNTFGHTVHQQNVHLSHGDWLLTFYESLMSILWVIFHSQLIIANYIIKLHTPPEPDVQMPDVLGNFLESSSSILSDYISKITMFHNNVFQLRNWNCSLSYIWHQQSSCHVRFTSVFVTFQKHKKKVIWEPLWESALTAPFLKYFVHP